MPLVSLANLQQVSAVNLLSDPGAIGGPKLVPSCAQVSIRWFLTDGKIAHNVMTGRYTGTFSGSVAQANAIKAALIDSASAAQMLTHMSSGTAMAGVDIRDINSANAPLIQSTTPGAPGTGTGAALPNEVALVVTLHTALAGRPNRGRIYIPGWVVGSVAADNTVIPGAVTDLQAWADTVQNALNGSGYQLVIGHPARQAYIGSTGTSHPARDAGSVPVTSLVVRDNHWDSQRRRGLK